MSGCGGGGGGGNRAPAPPVNRVPTASFTSNPVQGGLPLTVQFDATASADSDGTIRSYAWDFGEPAGGSNTSGVTTTHTYPNAGTFTVSLQVTDDDGAAASTTRTVTADPPFASISGTIQILASNAIDSDVNDVGSLPTPNDDFATAQDLPNPVTLGGFANLPLTGVGADPQRGNLYNSGDPGDFYAVSMAGNEVIILNIADSASAEQALYLYDAAQNLIDVDDGPDSIQSLQVPAPGTYFIEVRPVAGASNYLLTVGQDLLPARSSAPRLIDAFVPGEVLLTTDARLPSQALASDYGLTEVVRS
ncbi:MAG: PKD domain-containing protein, partial [Gammaproteobacteria bacterium]|nr:PKD domain-containing protein [Gammaproteobacteria bacterium]